MIRLDYFSELAKDSTAPSIRDFVGTLAAEDHDAVVRYLDNGVAITAVPGFEYDVIDGTLLTVSPSLSTDGEFVWRHDLTHYVRKYLVGLRSDFLAKVRGGAKPPESLSTEQWEELWSWFDSHP